MAKSSINIKPSSSSAIVHNERVFEVAYAIDSESRNEYKTIGNIKEMERDIYADYLEHHGRRLNSKATPIREAVINLNENHTMTDVENLCLNLQQEFKIQPLHIAIHRDEGHINKDNEKIYNYHAHVVFSNYDFETHRSIKLDKFDMSRMQTITANSLQMERGVEGSQTKRLEHREYKRAMQEVEKAVTLEHKAIEKEIKSIIELNNKYFNAETGEELVSKIEQKLAELASVNQVKEQYKSERQTLKTSGEATQKQYQELKIKYATLEQKSKAQELTIKELQQELQKPKQNVITPEIKESYSTQESQLIKAITTIVTDSRTKGFNAYKTQLEQENDSIGKKVALKALNLPTEKLSLAFDIVSPEVQNLVKSTLALKQQIEEVTIKKEVVIEVEKIIEIPKTVEVIIEKKIEKPVIYDIDINKLQAQEIKDLVVKTQDLHQANRQLKTEKHLLELDNQNLKFENRTLKTALRHFLDSDLMKGISSASKSLVERLNEVCEPIFKLLAKDKTPKHEKEPLLSNKNAEEKISSDVRSSTPNEHKELLVDIFIRGSAAYPTILRKYKDEFEWNSYNKGAISYLKEARANVLESSNLSQQQTITELKSENSKLKSEILSLERDAERTNQRSNDFGMSR